MCVYDVNIVTLGVKIFTDYHYYDAIYSHVHANELLHSCFPRLVFTNVSIRCGGKLPPKNENKFRLVENHEDL